MEATSNVDAVSKFDIGRPSPADFDLFLPWACKQLALEYSVLIEKAFQEAYTAAGAKPRRSSKTTPKIIKEVKSDESGDTVINLKTSYLGDQDTHILVNTTYDLHEELLQIAFTKNKYVPSQILQVIALIAQFYPRLSTICINGGLDQQGLHELCKIVNTTKISEVILDNNMIPEANYHQLLSNTTHLTYLSLARCSINDKVIEMLVSGIMTSSLTILNLSTNKITDKGAEDIANVLRVNRKLLYLNLAGNMITDTGAEKILCSLMEFPLTPQELIDKKERYITYWKSCQLREHFVRDKEMGEKKMDKKKQPAKPLPVKKGKMSNADEVFKNVFEFNETELNIPILKPLNDGFKRENLFTKDGVVYCYGNNVLSYLNLAYNDLTYFSVKVLLKVLRAQERLGRQPRGLVNVSIEGNLMPRHCFELIEISTIIDNILSSSSTPYSSKERKVGVRNTVKMT